MRFFLQLVCGVGGTMGVLVTVVLWTARPGTGYWLTYVMQSPGRWSEIVRANPDGSDAAVLTPGVAPVWAPDGRVLVFRAGIFGTPDLYRVGWDGNGFRQLTDSAAFDLNPVWAPDGSALVWSAEAVRAWQIGRLTPGDETVRWLTDARSVDESAESPTWSPDGRWITFVRGAAYGQRNIVLMSPDGAELRVIVRGEHPLWSPDGRWLVYECGAQAGAWCRVPVVAGEPQPDAAAPWIDDAFDLAWAPDGAWAVFARSSDSHRHLYIVPAAAGVSPAPLPVTDGTVFDGVPAWSPDGRWIAFERQTPSGGALIMRVALPDDLSLGSGSADGRTLTVEPQRISPTGVNARFPEWSPVIDLPLAVWPLLAVSSSVLGLRLVLRRKKGS